jgi:hypothetical protein
VPPVAVVYRPSPLSCRPSKLIVESSGVALLSLSLSPLVRCRPAAPCRCRAARRRRVPPVAIVVPPIEVDCRVIGRCPPLLVAVAARPPPPAALLSRRRCLSLNRRAAAAIS